MGSVSYKNQSNAYGVFRCLEPIPHCEAVPLDWLVDNEECFFPNVSSFPKLHALKVSMVSPFSTDDEWTRYKGVLLKRGVSLAEAVEKCKKDRERNFKGHVTTTDDEGASVASRKRVRPARFADYNVMSEGSVSSEEDPSLLRKPPPSPTHKKTASKSGKENTNKKDHSKANKPASTFPSMAALHSPLRKIQRPSTQSCSGVVLFTSEVAPSKTKIIQKGQQSVPIKSIKSLGVKQTKKLTGKEVLGVDEASGASSLGNLKDVGLGGEKIDRSSELPLAVPVMLKVAPALPEVLENENTVNAEATSQPVIVNLDKQAKALSGESIGNEKVDLNIETESPQQIEEAEECSDVEDGGLGAPGKRIYNVSDDEPEDDEPSSAINAQTPAAATENAAPDDDDDDLLAEIKKRGKHMPRLEFQEFVVTALCSISDAVGVNLFKKKKRTAKVMTDKDDEITVDPVLGSLPYASMVEVENMNKKLDNLTFKENWENKLVRFIKCHNLKVMATNLAAQKVMELLLHEEVRIGMSFAGNKYKNRPERPAFMKMNLHTAVLVVLRRYGHKSEQEVKRGIQDSLYTANNLNTARARKEANKNN